LLLYQFTRTIRKLIWIFNSFSANQSSNMLYMEPKYINRALSRTYISTLFGLFLCLLTDNLRRCRGQAVWIVMGIGIGLVLATQRLGSTGILLAIIGVAIAASLLLGNQQPMKEE